MRHPLAIASVLMSVALLACAVGSPDSQTEPDTTNVPALPSPSSPGERVPGSQPDAGGSDADHTPEASAPETGASSAKPGSCKGYAAPTETATCKCPAGKACGANNCYGGYYCELTTTPPKCVPKPASCS